MRPTGHGPKPGERTWESCLLVSLHAEAHSASLLYPAPWYRALSAFSNYIINKRSLRSPSSGNLSTACRDSCSSARHPLHHEFGSSQGATPSRVLQVQGSMACQPHWFSPARVGSTGTSTLKAQGQLLQLFRAALTTSGILRN